MINYTEQEEKKRQSSQTPKTSRPEVGVWIGIILIAAGALLFLNYSGHLTFAWRRVFLSWQMLLIAIGIVQLVKRNTTAGLILVIIGGFFMMPRLSNALSFLLPNSFLHTFWPILLVIAGIIVVISAIRRRNQPNNECVSKISFTSESKSHDGYLDENVLFSGAEYVVLDPVFKGGSINATFGGFDLDLRRTSLPEGTTTLKINALFGGANIILPETWYVSIKRNTILGGIDDKRRFCDNSSQDQNRKLILDINCIFGGVELK